MVEEEEEEEEEEAGNARCGTGDTTTAWMAFSRSKRSFDSTRCVKGVTTISFWTALGAHKILKKKTEKKKELLTSVRFVIKIFFTFLYLKEIALYIVENRYTRGI